MFYSNRVRLPTHLLPTRLVSRSIGHLLGGTTDRASDWLARRRGVPEMVVPTGDWVDLPGRGRTWLTDTGPTDDRAGDAPAVVLLHAVGCTGMLTWFPTVAELARTHRVVVFDQRRHGRAELRQPSGQGSEAFSVADCADDVAAVIAELGLQRPIVAGYSMGGVIAQRTWRRHPDVVGGLVLAATTAHFRVTGPELGFHQGVELAAGLLRLADRSPAARIAGRRTARALDVEPSPIGDWALREFRSTSPWAVTEALAALGRHHSSPWLDRIDVPTAVVVTAHDRVIPADRQRALAAAIPGATVHEAACGHAGCVLQAEAFVPVFGEAVASVRTRIDQNGPAPASEQCG